MSKIDGKGCVAQEADGSVREARPSHTPGDEVDLCPEAGQWMLFLSGSNRVPLVVRTKGILEGEALPPFYRREGGPRVTYSHHGRRKLEYAPLDWVIYAGTKAQCAKAMKRYTDRLRKENPALTRIVVQLGRLEETRARLADEDKAAAIKAARHG